MFIYIYIYIYIYTQKQDGYNAYGIIAKLSPKWPCGNSSTWAQDMCDVHRASWLYLNTCCQSSVIYVYVGVIFI